MTTMGAIDRLVHHATPDSDFLIPRKMGETPGEGTRRFGLIAFPRGQDTKAWDQEV